MTERELLKKAFAALSDALEDCDGWIPQAEKVMLELATYIKNGGTK